MKNLEADHPFEVLNIGQYLALLWHWAWLIALVALISGGMAFFISRSMTPIYQAKTTVMVNELTSSQTTDLSSIQLSMQLSQTYSQMMTKQPILDEVAKRLGLGKIDPKDVNAQAATNMQLINITAESPDPIQAAQIANMVVTVFSEQAQSLRKDRFDALKKNLQAQITETEGLLYAANAQLKTATVEANIEIIRSKIANYQQTYNSLLQSYNLISLNEAETSSNLIQIEPATLPEDPIRPKTLQNVAIATIVGLALAAGTIYIIGLSDRTLKTAEEITQLLGLPVLGMIPHHKINDGIPITEEQPRSPVSEAFRTLRTNLQFTGVGSDQPVRTILVTSTNVDEGKSTVMVNLGVVLAQNGQKVSLVDADLRRPSVHNLLNLINLRGLSQAFLQSKPQASLDNIVQSTRVKNLSAVTSGALPPNPVELLGSKKMGDILDELKMSSEVILIDTPPALAVSDAVVLMPLVQGVLLVMKPGSTRSLAARQLIEQLHRVGANILGVVVNEVKMRQLHHNYYYYQARENKPIPAVRPAVEKRLEDFVAQGEEKITKKEAERISSVIQPQEIKPRRGRKPRQIKVTNEEEEQKS